jgi:hypothetical protein
MVNKARISVEDAVRKAIQELVSYSMRHDAAYVQTPYVYDSGSTVVIEVRESGKGFLVSDIGGAFEEADAVGAEGSFARQAKTHADQDNVEYVSESFFLNDVPADELAGAVIAVAACSQNTAAHVVKRHLDNAREDQADRLIFRLERIFTKARVSRKFSIRGGSDTEWKVDAAVMHEKRPVLFEAVSIHSKNSIYQAVAKYQDIAQLRDAPKRISAVAKKEELGTYLTLLAQSSNVVQDTTSEASIRKLAS